MLPVNFSQTPSPIALHTVSTPQGAWEHSRGEGMIGGALMQGACTIQQGVRREAGEEAFETGPPGAEPGEIERQCLEGG